jgi:hypothetical protein
MAAALAASAMRIPWVVHLDDFNDFKSNTFCLKVLCAGILKLFESRRATLSKALLVRRTTASPEAQ